MSRRCARLCGDDRTPAPGRFSWAGLRLGRLPGRWRTTGDPDSRCRREVVSVEKRGAASSGGRSSSGRNTPCPNAGEAIPPPTGPISEASETPEATGPALSVGDGSVCPWQEHAPMLNWGGSPSVPPVCWTWAMVEWLSKQRVRRNSGNPSSLYSTCQSCRRSRQLAPHLFEARKHWSSRVGCAFVT